MTTLTSDQRARRGALIEQCYHRSPGRGYLAAIQEGSRQFRAGQGTGRITSSRPATGQKVIAEAVAAAVLTVGAARKAAKKAARRATAEAAAARVLQERQLLAARFTETAISASLRETSASDLAAITAVALSGTGQPGVVPRPVIEMTLDPGTLDLGDLAVAATAGTAGSSPFWGGSPPGASPFWRGVQGGGASKGTSDA